VPTLPLVVLAKEPSPTRVNIRLEQKKKASSLQLHHQM
jgi:hypothetical protein